jgi:hypothetical protein
MKNQFYTYAYLRKDGTPYYIGKGKGRRAFCNGGRYCRRPPRDRILLLKTGLTEEEAFKHEIYMIAIFGRKDIGTGILWNRCEGGRGNLGVMTGKRHSPETIEKIRKANKGNLGRTGQKNTLEHNMKISQAHRGKTLTSEHRQKLSESHRGKRRPLSPETKEKIRQSLLGRKYSPERCENMRQAALRRSAELKKK